jgi:hypothetical protein
MSGFEKVFGEQERKNALFEGQISDGVERTLQYLETQLLLLSDVDQDFILGCRMTLGAGGRLTPENQAEIQRIASTLTHVGHNIVGGMAESALSMQKVVKDLAGAIHMLTPQEQQFLQQMAGKVQGGVKLSVPEVEALVKIYGEKGF